MKSFFSLLAVLILSSFMLSSLKPGLSLYSTNKNFFSDKIEGAGVLLVYVGEMKAPNYDMSIGIHLEMDPSIGLRYEVVYEKGSNVLSHMSIFYKFSKPNQSVAYNYLTHKSSVINNGGDEQDKDPNVVVVGQETVDKYNCTHVQHVGGNGTTHITKSDYWMSTKLPGFQTLVNILNKINPGALALTINGTIFNWGGLVKMTNDFADQKTGASMNAEIHLVEANPDMNFPAKDFDIPSK